VDPVVLATFRDPWAYIAMTAVQLLAGGIRALISGTLRTGREAEALEKRAEVAEAALRVRDEQVNAALAVLPQVAEVLEKIHEARPAAGTS
jgi:hypothetical protein